MMVKRFLSVLLSASILTCTNSSFAINVFADNNSANLLIEKISEELKNQINHGNCDSIPVVIWYNGIDEEKIESKIKDKIGFNIHSIEEEYASPSIELLNKLDDAASNDADVYLKSLMQNHLKLTEQSRVIEKERSDLYRDTRRCLVKENIEKEAKTILDKMEIPKENLGYVSSYAPMIIAKLSANEIEKISEISGVREISIFTPLCFEECTADFGTTKVTMGIDTINEQIGLTGSGVNIGIYEEASLDPTYYSANGLISSHITRLSPVINMGSHATYCAGIAAGSAGIAPDAHIYSVSSKNDDDIFTWTDYSTAQMSDLERLIESNVDVINMSCTWRGQGNVYNNYAKYIDYLISNTNTTIVCSSGNDSSADMGAPATAYNAITVNGFIDQYKGDYSNILNDYTYKNENYCQKPDLVGPSLNNGTSTAAPYISGMIALMYQYKPALKVMPETTKAILMASCHKKCTKLLVDDTTFNLSEPMTSGLTDRQGAGIPNMYKMISIVSQHTYGNGILNANNNFKREVNFLQPKYNSAYINVSMSYLQTNVPSDTASGVLDDYDIRITNNNSTKTSNISNSSTEMIYKSLTDASNYKLEIYKFSGQSTSVRYAYAWSTDNERYYNNYENEGVFYLKNYNSSYYLARRTSDNKAYQTSLSNSLNSLWAINEIGMNGTYEIKSADIESSGLGFGSKIGTNNYYALDGTGADTSAITIQFNNDTGTYTFKRTFNGAIYALGINGNSISNGTVANWYPYSNNNNSQKWYLETANYRLGDVDMDGTITENDATVIQNYMLNLLTITNVQRYLSDANADNSISLADAIKIHQIIADN